MKKHITIDYLIVYEHPERELESIILIGSELKKRGFSVEYYRHCPSNYRVKNVFFNKVNTIIVPFMYSNQELYDVVYRIAGQVNFIINLQWEQVLTKETERNPEAFWFPHEMAQNVMHVCWGNKIKDNLLRVGVKPGNIILSGPIHIDFLRTEFRSYFTEKSSIEEEYGLRDDGKIILFISSFSAVKMSQNQIQRMYEISGKDYFDSFRNYSIDSQEKIVDILLKLAKEGYQVIYRPHPNEQLSECVLEAANNSNFKVIGDLSVKQWMLQVDYVFTWISTSFVESYFLNIPCGILRPIARAEKEDVAIYEGIQKLNSYDEVIKFINSTPAMEKNALLEEYYDFGKICSYIRLCDELQKITASSRPFEWPKSLISDFNEKRKKEKRYTDKISILHDVYILLKKVGIKNFDKGLRKKIKNRYVQVEELNDMKHKDDENALIVKWKHIEKRIESILVD